MYLLTYLLT